MPLEDQFKFHQEALRRSVIRNDGTSRPESLEDAARVAGLQVGDAWSSGGAMPGTMHPDLQGPTRPLTFEEAAHTGRTTANFADIVANVHNPKR